MKNTAIIEPGQSLLDIAVQHCGSVEAVLTIALANGLSVTEAVAVGAVVSTIEAANRAVANLFAVNGIKPATAITQTEALNTIADEGIEFWTIEEDFIIS